ncbi:response regulator transcription factor [Comamonas humi]
MRVVALDDDPVQLEMLSQTMAAEGHACTNHTTGTALLKDLRRETYDLLIIDWNLPDLSGPEIVRRIRDTISKELPILFITNRQAEADVVEGLESGADDFMVKPLRVSELVARVRALLRRAYPASTTGTLEFGRYKFMTESRVLEVDGQVIELKNREYDLALFLFQNMGRLLSRDHLREIIWGQNSDVISRSLDTHVSRLRTLLDLRPDHGYVINAVYGVGYRFEAVKATPEPA